MHKSGKRSFARGRCQLQLHSSSELRWSETTLRRHLRNITWDYPRVIHLFTSWSTKREQRCSRMMLRRNVARVGRSRRRRRYRGGAAEPERSLPRNLPGGRTRGGGRGWITQVLGRIHRVSLQRTFAVSRVSTYAPRNTRVHPLGVHAAARATRRSRERD